MRFLGIVGYGIGALAGVTWVDMMHTSSFEGYSGMLVFFGFAPVGAVVGALALPGLYIGMRVRRASASGERGIKPRRRSF